MKALRKPGNASDLVDEIELQFIELLGILGVCRVAAAAAAQGDVGGYILRDADLPDAIGGAVSLATSIKERFLRLNGLNGGPTKESRDAVEAGPAPG
jgi:hypothetical protein